MKNILWIKIPNGTAQKHIQEIQDLFEKEFKDEKDLRIIVTYGDLELKLFGLPIFVYPYWLLKLKMLFKK